MGHTTLNVQFGGVNGDFFRDAYHEVVEELHEVVEELVNDVIVGFVFKKNM